MTLINNVKIAAISKDKMVVWAGELDRLKDSVAKITLEQMN